MTTHQLINKHILSAYPEEFQAELILPLDALSSLSSCRHWIVQTAEEIYCLRRWPREVPKREQLEFQQAVLWHAVCEGIDFVPLPIETKKHQGFVSYEGCFWELLPWLDSNKDIPDREFSNSFSGDFSYFDDNSPYRDEKAVCYPNWRQDEIRSFQIASAMMSLAQFHQAVSSFPLPHFPVSVSLKVRDQLVKWERWNGGCFARLHQRLMESRKNENKNLARLADVGLALLDHALPYAGRAMMQLSRAARLVVPIQAVIGNCCRRHFRFDEEGLYGIIDFKEICVDSVAWDIATLLTSMSESNLNLWNFGLKAYQNVHPLEENEKSLVDALGLSPLFIQGLDFLNQIFLVEHFYGDEQLQEIRKRLESWNRLFENENRKRHSA